MRSKVVNRVIASMAVISSIMMYATTGFAALGPVNRLNPIPNWVEKTDPNNLFKIKDSTKQFILLDTGTDNNSKFFVLAYDHYGTATYDLGNTQKFDPADNAAGSVNIAYWLNHDFITSGNGTGNVLPPEIINNIDYNHQWLTEAGIPAASGGNCPTDYTVTCGIALMAQYELQNYISKFGLRDQIPQSPVGWWLRTGRGVSGNSTAILCVRTDSGLLGQTNQQTANSTGTNALYVRPEFYLNKNFFKSVKLDISALGANVKKAIAANYSADDLAGIYTDAEISALGVKPSFEITACNITSIGGGSLNNTLEGANSISVSADVYNNYSQNSSVTMVVSLYDANDIYLTTAIKNDNITSGQSTKNISNDLSFPSGIRPSKARIYFWDSISGMHTILKTIVFPNTTN